MDISTWYILSTLQGLADFGPPRGEEKNKKVIKNNVHTIKSINGTSNHSV